VSDDMLLLVSCLLVAVGTALFWLNTRPPPAPAVRPPSESETVAAAAKAETASSAPLVAAAAVSSTAAPAAATAATACPPELGLPLFETPLDALRLGARPKEAVGIKGAHGRPLRILCLHGQNSSSDVTLLQLGNLGLGHRLWCDLLDGPWDSDASPEAGMDDVTEAEVRSWWPWKKAGDEPDQAHLARCLRYVLHYLDAARLPYDGIYGFSQGAAIATLVSMPEVRQLLGLPAKPSWKFTICAHGMYPGGAWFGHMGGESMSGLTAPALDPSLADDAHFEGVPAELLAKVTKVVGLPSLHMTGTADHWRANAVRLAQMYSEPARFEHEGKHEIPAKLSRDSNCQKTLSQFFERVAPRCD